MVATVPSLTARQLRAMRAAGRVTAETLAIACSAVRPGLTTLQIDELVARDTRERGGRCATYGYRVPGTPPFPGHLCTSRNEVVCHGIPSVRERLEEGDIINLDVTTEFHGWHGDTSRTVPVGNVGPDAAHVIRVAEEALRRGIAVVRPGCPLGVIGEAIEPFVVSEGCTVVRGLGGHGIGRRMHQAPHVHHHVVPHQSPILRPGMCFTIEPMVCLGRSDVRLLDDGWTVVTTDGSLSAQFEHTVCVTEDGVEVLTRRE